MNKVIGKNEFIDLCELLESGKITLSEFNFIGNVENKQFVKNIILVMKIDNLSNKDYIFKIFLKNANNRNFEGFTVVHVLKENEKFRSDINRQKFMFDLVISQNPLTAQICTLVNNDEIFNNKDFLDVLRKLDGTFINFNLLKNLNELISLDKEDIYLKNLSVNLFSNLTKVNNTDFSRTCLECLKIKDVQKNPEFIDYLIKTYNYTKEMYHNYLSVLNCQDKLLELEENNRFEPFKRKLDEIVNSDLEEEDKDILLLTSFRNLTYIEEDIIKDYNEERFKFIMEFLPFYSYNYVIGLSKSNYFNFEVFRKVLFYLDQIRNDYVQRMVYEEYLINYTFFTDEDFNYFTTANSEEAMFRINEIRRRDEKKYLETQKEKYGEHFSEEFIDYLNNSELNEEELISIKENIKKLPSEFSHQDNTFIVDTSNIVSKGKMLIKD